jgi:hypothetical protein
MRVGHLVLSDDLHDRYTASQEITVGCPYQGLPILVRITNSA